MSAVLRILVLTVLATAVASPAALGARPEQNPHGRFLGIVKRTPEIAGAATSPALAPASSNLTYHNGPVMRTNRTHVILWAPSGWSFPSGYATLVSQYFTDVAHDSARRSNVYASDTQYYDTSGNIAYDSSYAGAIADTHAFPASGCPVNTPGNPCLTDAQLQSEIASVVNANSLPKGMGDVYFLMTPSGVDSCYDNSTSHCSYNYYCAYHSNFLSGGDQLLYANMPYPDLDGCDNTPSLGTYPGQHPNGSIADALLSVTSHEHNEAVTDPTGAAWYDKQGNENGDKCNFNFGTPLGGTLSAGTAWNQVINSHHYYLQREWSNADGGCVQNELKPPTAHATFSPSAPLPGQSVSFDGSTSTDPDGSIVSYAWTFGDGGSGSGATPSHTYSTAGTYHPVLTVTDDDGLTSTASPTVTVDTSPSCSATSAHTTPNTAVSVSLPCSDADASDTITRAVVSGPSHGTLGSINQTTGAVTYTPANGYSGSDSFTFRATDGFGHTSGTVTASLVIDTAPTANIAYTPSAPLPGDSVSFDGTGSTPGSSPISSYAWNFGDGGTSTSSTQSHTYPNRGSYHVVLQVTDGNGQTGSTSTDVVVDTPPACSSVSKTLVQDSSASVTLACSDPDSGDSIASRQIVSGPTHGTLGTVGSSVTYTPDAGYYGSDSFTFRATDTMGRQSPNATASITVKALPVANISFSPPAPATGASVSFDGSGSSDPDPAGTIKTYAWDFDDGSTLSGGPSDASPSHSFASAGVYHVILTVTDTDGDGQDQTTATVTVDTPPTCADATASTVAGSSVVVPVSCPDPDGGTPSPAISSPASHGSAVVDVSGNVVYTPADGFVGTDSFGFRATDAFGRSSAPATATVTVHPAASVPAGSGGGSGSPSGSTPLGTLPGPGTSSSLTALPHVTSLRISPRSLKAGTRSRPLVRWLLDLPGTTTFRVQRAQTGALVGGRCVKATSRNRSAPHCRRWVTALRTFTHAGVVGANSTRFSARRLKPGSYRLIASATDATGHAGPAVRTSFRVR